MINEKMTEALNQQINEELYSYYLYLSMSADFEDKNLPGFANWMYQQAQEEMMHAMKIYHFVIERGGRVKLLPIKGPDTEWDTPLAAFEDAYKHECFISDCINKLVDLATKESDHASEIFLQWFVTEQVEEEASVDEVVQQLKMIKDNPGGMFMIDRELRQRVFTPPAAGEEG